jgi:hypothetical protein
MAHIDEWRQRAAGMKNGYGQQRTNEQWKPAADVNNGDGQQ